MATSVGGASSGHNQADDDDEFLAPAREALPSTTGKRAGKRDPKDAVGVIDPTIMQCIGCYGDLDDPSTRGWDNALQ